MSAPEPVVVVGIGADGWAGLSAAARDAVAAADVVMGSRRQLDLLPDDFGGGRVSWPSPLLPALPGLLGRYAGTSVCCLASGDPMFFGLGTTLVRLLGADLVTVVPHPSSVSLACARLGWALDAVEVVSAVARPLAAVHPAVQPGRRLLVLSADGDTPGALAGLLVARGYGPSTLTVLENLGAPSEHRRTASAEEWAAATSPASKGGPGSATSPASKGGPGSATSPPSVAALNLVAVECRPAAGARHLPRTPGLPDDAFEHDGQITKREVRAVTLARLGPTPGMLLWDVGAGSGSIAIEWMRTHPSCRAIALEPRPDRADRIGRNADALGTPDLRIVRQSAPGGLAGLPTPAAVFVGGGTTVPGVLDACWTALPPGGRLVVNAVTLESETLLAHWHGCHGGELARLAVSRSAPVGGFTGWRPMMPVTQWAVTKPEQSRPARTRSGTRAGDGDGNADGNGAGGQVGGRAGRRAGGGQAGGRAGGGRAGGRAGGDSGNQDDGSLDA